MKAVRAFLKKYVPTWSLVAISVTLISIILFVISSASPRLADLLVGTLGFLLRSMFSILSYPFPLSLFELLVILAVPLTVTVTVLAVRRIKNKRSAVRAAISLVAVVGIVYTGYIYALGTGYNTTTLDERIGIEDAENISKEELYATIVTVRDEVNALADSVTYADGEGQMGKSLNEVSLRICDGYGEFAREYPFFINFHSRVKPIVASPVMSDMRLTGIYTFFTGEANVNIEYPDYDIVFTAAHELAHQRGMIRENEANFMAFLICTASDDPFIRYSGYLRMYEYLASALYRLDAELYKEVLSGLDERARGDIAASNEVTRRHKDSPLGAFISSLNDGYLKMNGTDGAVSYGYVVRLAVGMYQRQK